MILHITGNTLGDGSKPRASGDDPVAYGDDIAQLE